MFKYIKNILFLDFETYYNPVGGYTLRKMSIPEYLLDDKYETILCSVAVNSGLTHIIEGPDFAEWLAQFDPETTATVTFNALFDNAILAWHYGWVPKLMLDSMNIARALRGHILPRLNLETICKVFGLPHDKSTILRLAGMRRMAIKANLGLWTDFCAYANRDNERSRDIFKMLIAEMPVSEIKLMDLVIRTTVQPKFMVDHHKLTNHLQNLRDEKIRLLNACGAQLATQSTPDQIKAAGVTMRSDVKFKESLEALGVEIKYKPNSAGKLIPAFAKTDAFMEELSEHFDSRVQALAAARLGVKSTIEETRTEKLLRIAALPWDRYRDGSPRLYSGGVLPCPLRYGAAHTHRLGGDWGLNLQNLPAGRAGKTNMIRQSLVAPLGFQVIAGDLAQIEARLVAWIAKCIPLLHEFSIKGGDPYSAFASVVFGFLVNKIQHPLHRFIGKTGVLGLGYQCGVDKFYTMVLTLARLQGINLAAAGIDWNLDLAKRTVYGYREKYAQIANSWGTLQHAVGFIWAGNNGFWNFGPVTIKPGEVLGPNGLSMKYFNPQYINSEYVYQYGWAHYKMYGGKMLENIIQFLARIIIMNAAIRLNDLGYRFVHQAHDELVFIVQDKDCSLAKAVIHRELTRPPSWGKDIPLEAEVKSGPSYGACK